MITAREIRQKFIDFFIEKGHHHIASASLVPSEDPTVLFTTAGMHPLVPYLLGEKHPMGFRLVNYQKCVRTGDIDEVGDNSHLTFFEMLGNWSLGDYFKKDAIAWSLEFLTSPKWLHIPINMLSVSCFGGDDRFPKVPPDDEAAQIWESVGMPKEKIGFIKGGMLESSNNWWGPAGKTGPCGPDTEMFYFVGEGEPHGNPSVNPDDWLEIWNDVFMQYFKDEDSIFEPLHQKNVDTGMGLERVTAILNGHRSVYDTELFSPILKKITALAKIHDDVKSFRIIADHVRTMTFMAGDHVRPSNLGQGYVMRRLMRRAIRHGKKIGIEDHFLAGLAEIVVEHYHDIYPELHLNKEGIIKAVVEEEERFNRTILQGLREFEKVVKELRSHGSQFIPGDQAFHLYDTYGFPIEMTQDLARENELKVDLEGFQKSFSEHQEKSRITAGLFQGGLADHSEESTRLHTATHLLHQALRSVLGNHVYQRGSNITRERLRFDFTHSQKLSPEQVKSVEDYVNQAIRDEVEVSFKEMSYEEAKEYGAIGLFEQKYGEKVKVYSMGKYSKEVCGGPHVKNTRELKRFKIMKEESCAAGMRRIKAIVEAGLSPTSRE